MPAVAPIQTLIDKECQIMRDQSLAVIRGAGVEAGGSNIQFGCKPVTSRMVVIVMNLQVRAIPHLRPRPPAFPSRRSSPNARW
jgi:carbamoyl-phosphate synthase large subunit